MTTPQTERVGITEVDVDLGPNVYSNRFRRKRFQNIVDVLKLIPEKDKIRVLDIGGVIPYWEGVRDLWSAFPLEITLVNIGAKSIDRHPYYSRAGDACGLGHYADGSFDLVHSNSVIEHVGRWPQVTAMANEVRRLAPHHFVQTPNFFFPLEPHYRTMFFHWYPEALRARMMMTKKRGFCDPLPTLDGAMRHIQSVNLLTGRQMQELFPESNIAFERVFGLKKSIMAIK